MWRNLAECRPFWELEHRNVDRYDESAEAIRGAFDSPQGWNSSLKRLADVIERST